MTILCLYGDSTTGSSLCIVVLWVEVYLVVIKRSPYSLDSGGLCRLRRSHLCFVSQRRWRKMIKELFFNLGVWSLHNKVFYRMNQHSDKIHRRFFVKGDHFPLKKYQLLSSCLFHSNVKCFPLPLLSLHYLLTTWIWALHGPLCIFIELNYNRIATYS